MECWDRVSCCIPSSKIRISWLCSCACGKYARTFSSTPTWFSYNWCARLKIWSERLLLCSFRRTKLRAQQTSSDGAPSICFPLRNRERWRCSSAVEQCRWYLASIAMRSPPSVLAINSVSCNSVAICLMDSSAPSVRNSWSYPSSLPHNRLT
jgi:hypothetical protein